MALHSQTHSAIGSDHAIIGGSAYYFLGINSSGTPLEWQVLKAGSLMYFALVGSTVVINNNPGDEEYLFLVSPSGGGLGSWTNMPAALTEFGGQSGQTRVQCDLTFMTSARATCNVFTAATAGAMLGIQVSSDNTNWQFLGTTGTTSPAVRADSTGLCMTSPWVLILAAARRDVALRVVGSGGDGAIDPVFNKVTVQFR